MCEVGTVGHLLSRATNFMDFGDFHKICFTENQQNFYSDMDCRLKRRHQCRFVKMVSLNFTYTNLQPSKKAPYGSCRTVIGQLQSSHRTVALLMHFYQSKQFVYSLVLRFPYITRSSALTYTCSLPGNIVTTLSIFASFQ